MGDAIHKDQAFWNGHARRDPLWAILSDPSKTGRRWDLQSFLATGEREISLLMYHLRGLGIDVRPEAALDFGCGVGRLTAPLARHFTRVVGVDISPEMIRIARDLHGEGERVRFVCNAREDLQVFATSTFTFIYSNVVLQHIEPDLALGYLGEFFRILAPGGVLVFQLPSHPRPLEEQQRASMPMPDDAYRAAILVQSDVPHTVEAGAEVVLSASVTNASRHAWDQRRFGPIRFGNHWLTAAAGRMLIQDDGRAVLAESVGPGESCGVAFEITAPSEPGEYQLECDLVHEGITWFGDRGATTWRTKVRVSGAPVVEPARDPSEPPIGAKELLLPDDAAVEEPGPLPMHGIHRDRIEPLIRDHGATLVHLEPDERCGREWVGYRYFVKKPG